MNRALILFPLDSTTSFLEKIIIQLFSSVHSSNFALFKIECTDECHELAIKEISKPEYSIIVFLGHGNSYALKGSRNETYKKEIFLSYKEFSHLKEKIVILLSCESSSLLKRSKPNFIKGLGFEDLPTDWNDVQAARELDSNAYKGFTQETINSFQECLTDVFKYSLCDFLRQSLEIEELRNLIVLRINKRIALNYKQKSNGFEVLNDCLLNVKTGIEVH